MYYCRLVEIVGTRESISKAFAAIGKKIELVRYSLYSLGFGDY